MPSSASWKRRYDKWFTIPGTVVAQPTTWCNMNCTYCYLPLRRFKRQMSTSVANALAASVAAFVDRDHIVAIVWHGGEPLAVGPRTFATLLAPFEDLRRAGRIRHYVQTNATLITKTWCGLLAAYDFRVGVSVDGPRTLNAERVDLKGKPAFDRILRGIRYLREHNIEFSTISVVGTGNIDQPEELLDYLADLGSTSLGLNFEEMEGMNVGRTSPTFEQAENFWQKALAWTLKSDGATAIREIERLAEYLRLVRSGQRVAWERCRLDPIPTVSWNGKVILLSPELADTSSPVYGDFLAGNILDTSLTDILHSAHQLRYVQEFITGLEGCRTGCEYFDFCRGAQAANRYFENGSLMSTTTNFCRVSRQALVTALSTITAREEKKVSDDDS